MCGEPLHYTVKFCPYCGFALGINRKEPEEFAYEQQEQLFPRELEEEGRKKLTKKKKIAIIVGAIVILAAIIIPAANIAIYETKYLQKKVSFYVNNGLSARSYTVKISREKFNYYKNAPHPYHTSFDANYTASVIESYCTPDDGKIIQIAEDVRSKCIDPYDSEEIINALLSFTQAITYKYDIVDLAQYPLETIFEKGDCEDLSILFGSLVEALGYNAIIMVVEYYDEIEAEWVGHACVGVYLSYIPTAHLGYPPSHSYEAGDLEYWICETTAQGYMIGHLPASNPSYFSIEGYAYIN
ncbi:MAG: hypothetical protein ACFFBC_09140 [Promethearchaeota archaeon]